MSNGSDTVANLLIASLLAGETFADLEVDLNDPSFDLPGIQDNPLYQLVTEITNENLTTREVGGTGTYDAIMQSQANHLKDEFNANRITGAEYTKAYVALAQSAMGQGVQFLLSKDQAYWASVNAQTQALIARVQLQTTKAQLAIAIVELDNQRVTLALNKVRLVNEDAQYGIAKYNLDNILPAQLAISNAQKLGQDTTNLIADYTLATKLPAENAMLTSQKAVVDVQKLGQEKSNETATYNLSTMLPEQVKVIKEQVEAARAQTMNTRLDGTIVTGSVGKQNELYSQQITSYKRSSELNAAKVFSEAWIAHKSIDEGIDTPSAFNVTTISGVLSTIKTNNTL